MVIDVCLNVSLIYTNWTQFRRWPRGCVVLPSCRWPLAVTPALLACFVSCWIYSVGDLFRIFVLSLPPSPELIPSAMLRMTVLLQQLTRYNSLDLFINSFLGTIPSIWANIPLILRGRGITEGWSSLRHELQWHCCY